jgi:hypothetical protein
MTPEQKIKQRILLDLVDQGSLSIDPAAITSDNVDELYEDQDVYDLEYEFRQGEVETDLPCEYSRHYESRSVAAQMADGSWVGWTYWSGGGKHGEPESIPWMSEAYELDVKEEEKLVIVQTFSKKGKE